MSYIGSQTHGKEVIHDEIISLVGDISTLVDSIRFSIDTVNVKQIDLLELRFRPDPTEIAANLDILYLSWKNTILTNNAAIPNLVLFPSREADGSYRYEPNHPPNMFVNNCAHTHLSKKLAFTVKKSVDSTSLRTVTFLARFKVTKYMATSVDYEPKFMEKILNQ